ncbi:MAG TPA: PadR family transcriptional regulator [Solirubrobacteraceae bacterium]
MARRFSPQTVAVLVALAREPEVWRHGYDLGRETGLRAGTLYPILMRLCDRGLLEAVWEDEPPLGRPRRHLYRLLAEGQRAAESVQTPPAPGFRVVAEGAR